MAVRRERVVLELEDRFTSGIARAAAATALYKKELQSLSGTNVSATRTGSDLERQTDRIGNSMSKNGSELDRFTGRAKLLANVAAALGPSLVPIGAVAIPAVTGLASSLGFLTLGVGTSVLAFQGLGDALKAMDDAALDPTQAHLDKAQQTLELLAPSARAFARELHGMMGVISQLRISAGAGMFPGLTVALDDLEHFVPRLGTLMQIIGTTTGRIAADVAGSLASGEWEDFIQFLEREGPHALSGLAEASGNTVHAMAELWMAFTPVNNGFLDWLVRATDDLDTWATKLKDTDGFREFVAYIQENGPQVAATFGAIGNAVLQIIEAAAPLGGPVLRVVEDLANALATIADSPAGSTIMTIVTAMSALRLATSAQRTIADKTWGAPQITKIRGFTAALTGVTSAQQRATLSAQQLAAAEEKRARTTKQGIRTMGTGAATLGVLAASATGVTDQFGLANTASLALAGSMAGPWGAAIGGAIGLVSDLNAALAPGADEIDNYTQRILTLAGPNIPDQLKAITAAIDEQKAKVDSIGYFSRLGSTLSFGAHDDSRGPRARIKALTEAKKDLEAQTKREAAAQEYANSASGKAALKAREQIAAQQALQKSVADVSAKFLDYSKNADNAKVSLTDFLRGMEQQAAALQQFGENAIKAGKKGLNDGLIKYLESLGPAGALRMKQLANATDETIDRANNAWRKGQIAAKSYGQAVGAIPKDAKTKVDADTKKARGKVNTFLNLISSMFGIVPIKANTEPAKNQFADFLATITGKTVTVGVTTRVPKGFHMVNGILIPNQADGGTVPGQRTPYGDKVLIHAAPGEEIITNRNGEADRFRADRAAGRIPAYADGGTVRGQSSMRSWLNGGTDAWSGVLSAIAKAFKFDIPDSLNDWKRALDRSEKAIDKEREKRDDLVQKQSELVNAVAEKLRSDLFTTSSSSDLSVWLSAAQRKKAATGDVFGTLRGDIQNATAMKQALATLKKKGLDGAAFANVAQNADLGQAQALAGMSAKDVRRFEWLFNRRQQLTQGVGSFAGSTVYGDQIKEQNAHLRALLEANHRIAVRLHELEKLAKANPKAVGAAVGDSIKSIGGRK